MSGPPPILPVLRADIVSLVFTHKSLFGKPSNLLEDVELPQDWERLSFLGEGILHMATSNLLYLAYPKHRTSFLKPLRVQITSKEVLASITDRYRFMDHLRCLEASRPAISRSLDNRAALAESFVGGIALQYGTQAACEWAEDLLIWKHELQISPKKLRRDQPLSNADQPAIPPTTSVPAPPKDMDVDPPIQLEDISKFNSSQPSFAGSTPASGFTSSHLPLRPKAPAELPFPSDPTASAFTPAADDNLAQKGPTLDFFDSIAAGSTPGSAQASSSRAPRYHALFSDADGFQPWQGANDPNLALYPPSPEYPSTPLSTDTASSAAIPVQPVQSLGMVNPNIGAVAKLNEIASRRGQKPEWAFESEGQGAFIQWTATLSLRKSVVATARGASKQMAKDLAAQNAMESLGWV